MNQENARYNSLRKRTILPPQFRIIKQAIFRIKRTSGFRKDRPCYIGLMPLVAGLFVSCPLLAWKEIMGNYGKLFNNTQGAPCWQLTLVNERQLLYIYILVIASAREDRGDLKRNKENKIYGKKESGSGDCPAIRSHPEGRVYPWWQKSRKEIKRRERPVVNSLT